MCLVVFIILQDTFEKKIILNFTHELNKNNRIYFFDVLIDINNNINNNNLQKNTDNNSCKINLKCECPIRYNRTIIFNLISRAKLIS